MKFNNKNLYVNNKINTKTLNLTNQINTENTRQIEDKKISIHSLAQIYAGRIDNTSSINSSSVDTNTLRNYSTINKNLKVMNRISRSNLSKESGILTYESLNPGKYYDAIAKREIDWRSLSTLKNVNLQDLINGSLDNTPSFTSMKIHTENDGIISLTSNKNYFTAIPRNSLTLANSVTPNKIKEKYKTNINNHNIINNYVLHTIDEV